MTFINLKHFKEKIAQIVKIGDRNNPFVKLTLSKGGQLSCQVLFGMDGQISVDIESRTIKNRSQIADKSVVLPIDLFSRIVRNLPILLEEVKLEFVPPGLIITGGYGEKLKPRAKAEESLYSMRYELNDCVYLHKRDYDVTEEKVVSFATGREIASILTDATKILQRVSNPQLDNLFLSCKEDEILVSATDGNRIFQKYVYTQKTLDKDIDLVVSSELGAAIGKFAFQVANWEVYQNFVKITLDDTVEIFASRPLMSWFPDFQKWGNKSGHTTLVVNASELKTRLNKLGKDVWLWLYTVEDRLAIECFEGSSVGTSWVKNTLKVPPALIITNSKLLLDVLKTVKKGTSQVRFMLPKLVAEDEAEDFFNSGKDVRNVAYLEFDKNSYLIAGRKKAGLQTPPGVCDWLIAQGWSILPESKPASTTAKPVVKILSDRWTGKGWERPELVECDCGVVHDDSILQPQIKRLRGYCGFCEDYRELALHGVDYRCTNPTCHTLNKSTVGLPISEPVCMNCEKKEFTTAHYLECCECERPVEVKNCKACPCDAILEEDESMWRCGACESTFFVDDICDEEDFKYLQETEDEIVFVGCPCCERFDVELTSSPMYSCFECGSITDESFYIPAIEAPSLPCSECNEDLSDVPPQKINDPFVVGGVTRF